MINKILVVAVTILMSQALVNYTAATFRDDISTMNAQIDALKTAITNLDADILSQQNIIVGAELEVENAKANEKAWASRLGDSWTSQLDLETAQAELRTAEKELVDAKAKLQDLMNQRNDAVVKINNLNDEIDALLLAPTPQRETYNMYGLSYDNTCKTLLKNNISTTCPTYEDVITLFPDTSNRKISGEFGYSDGIYQRLPTKLHNSFEYYRLGDSSIIFVDPPVDTRIHIRTIEIKSSLDQYILRGQKTYNPDDNSITLGSGRFVDKDCKNAVVDSKSWIEWVGDTINYMEHSCDPNYTKMNQTTTINLAKTKMDITSSYKWKLEQFQKKAIEQCGTKVCINLGNQTAPP